MGASLSAWRSEGQEGASEHKAIPIYGAFPVAGPGTNRGGEPKLQELDLGLEVLIRYESGRILMLI